MDKNIENDNKIDLNFNDQFEKFKKIDEIYVNYNDVKPLLGFESKKLISDIFKNEIYGFEENVDYKIIDKKENHKTKKQFYLTTDTLKLLCLIAPTDENKGKQFRRYLLNNTSNNSSNNTLLQSTKYEFDVNKYKNKEIVYIIKIKDNTYKFGMSCQIDQRLSSHARLLAYDCVIKCWDCGNKTIAKQVEDSIKLYVVHENISIQFTGKYGVSRETFKTDNINSIITIIDDYVDEFTKDYKKQFQDEKLRQQTNLIEKQCELAKINVDIIKNINNIAENSNVDKKISNKIAKNLSMLVTNTGDISDTNFSIKESKFDTKK